MNQQSCEHRIDFFYDATENLKLSKRVKYGGSCCKLIPWTSSQASPYLYSLAQVTRQALCRDDTTTPQTVKSLGKKWKTNDTSIHPLLCSQCPYVLGSTAIMRAMELNPKQRPFYSTSVPLPNTSWVSVTFSSLWPLYSEQCHQ